MANNSMMGSPFTRTTKFPRPGFSGLITTVVSFSMTDTIFFARVINADHCLQASIVTTAAVAAAAVSPLLLLSMFVLATADTLVTLGAITGAFLVVAFEGLVVVVVAFFTFGFEPSDSDADNDVDARSVSLSRGCKSFFAAKANVRSPLVVDRVDRTIV